MFSCWRNAIWIRQVIVGKERLSEWRSHNAAWMMSQLYHGASARCGRNAWNHPCLRLRVGCWQTYNHNQGEPWYEHRFLAHQRDTTLQSDLRCLRRHPLVQQFTRKVAIHWTEAFERTALGLEQSYVLKRCYCVVHVLVYIVNSILAMLNVWVIYWIEESFNFRTMGVCKI